MNPYNQDEVIDDDNRMSALTTLQTFYEELSIVPFYVSVNNSIPILLPKYFECQINHEENWLLCDTYNPQDIPRELLRTKYFNWASYGHNRLLYIARDREETFDLTFMTIFESIGAKILFGTMNGYFGCIKKRAYKMSVDIFHGHKFQQGITAICSTMDKSYWVIAASKELFLYRPMSNEMLRVDKCYGLILGIWQTSLGHLLITEDGDVIVLKIRDNEFYNQTFTKLANRIQQAEVFNIKRLTKKIPAVIIVITCCGFLAIYEIIYNLEIIESNLIVILQIPDNSIGIKMAANERYLFTTATLSEVINLNERSYTSIAAIEWTYLLKQDFPKTFEPQELQVTGQKIRRMEVSQDLLIIMHDNYFVTISEAFTLRNLYLIKLGSYVERMIVFDFEMFIVFEEFELLCNAKLPLKSYLCHQCFATFYQDFFEKALKYEMYICPHYFE